MQKNVASQKIAFFAVDTTTGVAKTGDAANITAYVSKDGGTVTVLADTSATEMSSTLAKGMYLFDVAQAESNADLLVFTAKSTTANIQLTPISLFTEPPNVNKQVIDSNGRVDTGYITGTLQTTRDLGLALPAVAPGTAGGLLRAGTNTDTTFANLTVTSNLLISGNVTVTGNWLTTGTTTWTGGFTTSHGDFSIGDFNMDGVTVNNNVQMDGNVEVIGNYTIDGTVAVNAGVLIQQSQTNTAAVGLVGNGSGSGIEIDGGTNGDGISIVSQGSGKDINLAGDGKITGGLTGSVGNLLAIAASAINNAAFAADTGKKTIRSGTAQAGTSLTITLDSGASAVNDFYKNDLVVLTGGTGAGQARFITSYNGTTKAAVVAAWATNPDATSSFAVLPFDSLTTSLTAAAIDTQLSSTHGSGAWGTTVTGGAFTITITVVDGSAVALQNVNYGIYDGGGALVGIGLTNAGGHGSFSANAGTYTVALVKGGYTFVPLTRTVTGNQTGTLVNNLVMTATSIPSPSSPNLCNVGGTLIDGSGNLIANATGSFSLKAGSGKKRPLVDEGNVLVVEEIVFTTNGSGAVKAADGSSQLAIVRTDGVFQTDGSAALAYWLLTCPALGLKDRIIYVTTSTLDLSAIALS